MEKINDELIKYAAKLSKINLTENEKENMKDDLTSIMGSMECFLEANDTDISPLYRAAGKQLFLREDKAESGFDREEMLKNAKYATDEYFVSPRILD